jgi:uncharacterized protein YfaS (alpha-2-macroglobulin family)
LGERIGIGGGASETAVVRGLPDGAHGRGGAAPHAGQADVINDPIPAGATIIGDLGGQSQMLADKGQAGDGTRFNIRDADGKLWDVQAGVSAAYVERRNDSWRAYFDWVPRGRFAASYLIRLNGAGRFQLPPSRVEAMYSPAIRAQVPLAPMVVEQR